MIFTPEERRALLALGTVLVFGQALAWLEDWRQHAPDRELAAWLDQVRSVQAEADSAAVPTSAPGAPDPGPIPIPEEPLSHLPPGILETGRVRIDLATAEELTTLPGIGPSLAERIVTARAESPFRAVDDLLRVKGIGPKTLDRLRDHVSVETPAVDADSTRGEQHVDAAESRRRSETGAGGSRQ